MNLTDLNDLAQNAICPSCGAVGGHDHNSDRQDPSLSCRTCGECWDVSAPTRISSLILKHGITCEATFVPGRPEGWAPGSYAYRATLALGDKRLTVPFHMGPAHKCPPSALDVLSCCLSDAMGVEGETFESWAGNFGYDADSIKALKTFNACREIAHNLALFLGDHFDTFRNAEMP